MMKLYIFFIIIKSIVSLKMQHIKTPCLSISCYDQHYNSIFIEINKNPGYVYHDTIQLYGSLFTTIIYN
jgi:hypothetical protein